MLTQMNGNYGDFYCFPILFLVGIISAFLSCSMYAIFCYMPSTGSGGLDGSKLAKIVSLLNVFFAITAAISIILFLVSGIIYTIYKAC